MRRLVCAIGLLAAMAATASATPSDPPFLGISFGPASLGCLVRAVTPSSPAEAAGLQPDDVIVAIDKLPAELTTLNAEIVKHQPGDTIALTILRHGSALTLTAVLSTRGALFDRLLGHAFPIADTEDSVTHHAIELARPHDGATVIAWYTTHSGSGTNCSDPLPVVRDVGRRIGDSARVLAGTYSTPDDANDTLPAERARLQVPIVVTSQQSYNEVAIDECGRVFVMVLDRRGVVRFLTPLTSGEDEDAALDEITSAAAQAGRAR